VVPDDDDDDLPKSMPMAGRTLKASWG